jgi:hypothetical protein
VANSSGFPSIGERGLAMTVWKLDFGEGDPAAGYQGVDFSTYFHLEREFGWIDRSEIQTRDRRVNNRILGRFVAATSPATLRVILDPGRYILHVVMGDKDFSGHILQLKLSDNDEIFPVLTAEAGEYAVLRTVVDVPISFLDLTFSSPVANWVLNSVTLEPDRGGYDTVAKVIRRKFSDRFEDSVASEHVITSRTEGALKGALPGTATTHRLTSSMLQSPIRRLLNRLRVVGLIL